VLWAIAAAQNSAPANKIVEKMGFIGKSPSFTCFEEGAQEFELSM
jgi:hypothetical protein